MKAIDANGYRPFGRPGFSKADILAQITAIENATLAEQSCQEEAHVAASPAAELQTGVGPDAAVADVDGESALHTILIVPCLPADGCPMPPETLHHQYTVDRAAVFQRLGHRPVMMHTHSGE